MLSDPRLTSTPPRSLCALRLDSALTPSPLLRVCSQFEIRNLDPQSKSIYTHITCATDTHNVTVVFSAVKDIILRKNLGKVGLL